MKNRNRSAINILLSALLLLVLFTGCAKSGGESESGTPADGAQAEAEVYYSVQETVIPDPDLAMSNQMEEGDWLREVDMTVVGDTVYRVTNRFMKSERSPEIGEMRPYLQILKPPYAEWESTLIPASYWDEALDDETALIPIFQILGAKDGQVFLEVNYWGGTYLGIWEEGEKGRLLGKLKSETAGDESFFLSADQTGYCYREKKDTYDRIVLDQEPDTKKVNGQIYGFFQDPADGGVYWYGLSQGKFGAWNADSGAVKGVWEADTGDFSFQYQNRIMVADGAGGVCLADRHALSLSNGGGAPVILFDFNARGYDLDDFLDLEPDEDDGFLALTKFESRLYLLELERSERPENRQELVLAIPELPRSGLSMLISRFNRQNDGRYHVTVREREENESWEDYVTRLQLELSDGKGPDLYSGSMFEPVAMVHNGNLQSLEGILEDEGDYWSAALDKGKIDGVLYGIPCECTLFLTAYDEKMTGNRQSWTLPEMMEAVQNSGIKMLERSLGGCDTVLFYGLFDNDNKAFIDWEAGESHLTEEPFLHFLEFVKEYADTGRYTEEEKRQLEKDGLIAAGAAGSGVASLGDMNYLEARYNGRASVIGYPRSQGNGIYVRANCLYLSASSDKREAAEAFFRFLLSEESQNSYAEFLTSRIEEFRPGDTSVARDPYFPVRLDAIERMIRTKQAERVTEEPINTGAVVFQREGLSEESAEKFRFLVEHALPDNWYAESIRGIVYEELEPYFSGQRSAEETARILDNKVQLYLDEHR